MSPPVPASRFLVTACAVGFAIAHTQAPLFYSNQNQYLLHGLANAGYGHLGNDWLANTKDPTPLFSLGIEWSYRLAGLWPIHAIFTLILIGYFLIAWGLARTVTGMENSRRALLLFSALFTAAHAAILRLWSVKLTGVDYPWFAQAGVAGQYTLGPGLQPSCFAILLFASLLAFASGRPVLASALAALASWFHPTYLLPAAFLTFGYMTPTLFSRDIRKALWIGLAALLVALPSVIYVLIVFRPDNPAMFAESQRILATLRIPHHAVISRWFDWVAGFQLIWIGLGLFAIRRTALGLPLVVATGLSCGLSLVQYATNNPTLALLFPWRLSVVIVPFSSLIFAILLAKRLIGNRFAVGGLAFGFVLMVVGGVIIMSFQLGYAQNDSEQPLFESVNNSSQPNDVYLIPAKIPAVGTGRGSMSASFTPPPRPKPGSNLIPVDLQRFRLMTGTPIYVDFKSVPYAPDEVLEWERRMRQVEQWYANDALLTDEVLEEMESVGITMIIRPNSNQNGTDSGNGYTVDSIRMLKLLNSLRGRKR
jgi:hypothetical protein